LYAPEGRKESNIIIPEGVEKISDNVFSSFNSLVSVKLPSTITTIGDHAFASCYYLESIIIPKNVLFIDNVAFGWCSSLTIYCEASSKPSGWDSKWNYSNRPVYWAGEWEYDADGNPTPII
jgi:hypothetical protein